MKRIFEFPKSRIQREPDRPGESLEEFLRKATLNKEPIEATAKIQYTERKDGVLPQYDIRTDRFHYAIMAADRVHMAEYAKRMAADGFKQDDNGKWVQDNSNDQPAAEN